MNTILSISFLAIVDEVCDEGQVRLPIQERPTTFSTGDDVVETIAGALEVCVDGDYLQICSDAYIDQDFENNVCQYLGYDSEYLNMPLMFIMQTSV